VIYDRSIWSAVEISTGLFVISAPIIKPLIQKVAPGLLSSKPTNSRTYGRSPRFPDSSGGRIGAPTTTPYIWSDHKTKGHRPIDSTFEMQDTVVPSPGSGSGRDDNQSDHDPAISQDIKVTHSISVSVLSSALDNAVPEPPQPVAAKSEKTPFWKSQSRAAARRQQLGGSESEENVLSQNKEANP
jgi:hypothetical protein